MSTIESLAHDLYQPLSADQVGRVPGEYVAAEPAATFERYIDVLPDGTIAYGYVQVD